MRSPRASGYTMLEVMIVLVILAILAAIAFPSYQEAIVKAKRTEGRTALMKAMQQQERYYSLHSTYLEFSFASTDADGRKFSWFSGETSTSSSYEISAQACKDKLIRDCVLLIAQPGTAKVDARYRDPVCGQLSLSSTGEKLAHAAHCW
jgi:type IV pilus assembly protein PilE